MLSKFLDERRYKYLTKYSTSLGNRFSTYSAMKPKFHFLFKLQYRWLGGPRAVWDAIRYGPKGAHIVLDQTMSNVSVSRPMFSHDVASIQIFLNGHSLHSLLKDLTQGEVHVECITQFDYFDLSDPYRDRDLAVAFRIDIWFHRAADATLFKLSI